MVAALHKFFKLSDGTVSVVSEISVTLVPPGNYKIYLAWFAEILGIDDEKGIWNRGLSGYFKKRTNYPIKVGTGGRSYILLPKTYVKAVLEKGGTLVYDANYANDANSAKPSNPNKLKGREWE